jgi:tRNA-specific 2-thiouridylase
LACNRHIKFDKLKEFAHSLDATHLATGHYARIVDDNRLFEAADPSKDQSYVLYNATKEGLSETLFPVGDKPKSEIRAIGRRYDLPNWDKEDSQEICFVPSNDYRTFVQGKIKIHSEPAPATAKPGDIRDKSGKILGQHQGVAFYTVGQRKGLGLTTKEPMYVTRLDAATNTVVVGLDSEGYSAGLSANDMHWIHGAPPENEFSALVKIRYKHTPTPATVSVGKDGFTVRFDEPQRAVTPGQAAVIYRFDSVVGAREVLGGGKITAALS